MAAVKRVSSRSQRVQTVRLHAAARRATLLIPSGPPDDPDRKHLFILLTDPRADDTGTASVLMVSLSTIRQGVPFDHSCLLYPADHPFVRRNSYVVYQRARLEAVDVVLRGIHSGHLVPQAALDGAVFARVCRGFEESRLTPPRLLDFYHRAAETGS